MEKMKSLLDNELDNVYGGYMAQPSKYRTKDGREIQLGLNSPDFTCPWCGSHGCFTTSKSGPLLCYHCEWNENKGWQGRLN